MNNTEKQTPAIVDATLPVDGGLHVRQDGPGDAPALLLIHGTASSAISWGAMVPLLADDHRVIRVDLLGCGRSAKPEGAAYDIASQARRVGEALDLLGVTRVVVAGHSSGGVAATALAAGRPDLVAGAVLINTGPGMGAFTAQHTAGVPAQWPPTEEQIRAFVATGFADPDFAIPREFIEDLRDTPLSVYAAISDATRAYLEEEALPSRLAKAGKPLLVIFGEEDARWRPSSAADYLAVSNARVHMLSGVGHTPILEDPPRTAEHLLAFAESL
ncbi:MAG TPA: alpha/beta hydrolase [Stackebrandtia sp.]|jgi:pimeloyl-ACP methyl ester carboxylesterase|uniref:alpha/beta fold hydrolase n=1 Tax=Stackebrandtia sp. TaxID=2023065 RepID=UPI002D54300F|nr:alpha/beta hydrolase [Stackebrandtia sp.]HZE39172.1 alpha/beta hydrolase [Stackebrandtia sp.]